MKNLILLIACCSAFAACGGNAVNTNTATNTIVNSNANSNAANAIPANSNSSQGYPKETADAFLKSCESAGSDKVFCACVFDRIQAEYSLEEFSAIEDEIQSGEPPKEFVEFSEKARAECEKSGDGNGSKKD